MPNITPRKNKNGEITSYTIRVYHGYDGAGKRLKPYTMSWKPAPGMTQKQIEKELNRQAVQFEEQCRNGYALDNKQTFAEYAEYVLKCKEENGIKTRTIESYTKLMERINAGIGHIKLADLRPQHLSCFYSQLRKSGIRESGGTAKPTADLKKLLSERGVTKEHFAKVSGVSLGTLSQVYSMKNVSASSAEKICKALNVPTKKLFDVTRDNRPLSEKTVSEYHRLISTILAQAEREMLVQYNAAEKVVNKPKATTKADINYFELEELGRIQECLEKEPLKWQVFVHLLIVTGCRRGEIAGLKWSAVDPEGGKIHICNNLLYSLKKGVYQDTTKTDTSNRYVQLSEESLELLKSYKHYWDNFRRESGTEWNSFVQISDRNGNSQTIKADYLFFQDKGNKVGYPIRPDSITSWCRKFSKNNNLPHINPHAFRHTMASILYFNGIDSISISSRLGHSKASTTSDIYSHIIKEADKRSAECIADVIFRSKQA